MKNTRKPWNFLTDAQWTNKRRLSDAKLLDLIEHFSEMNLSVENVLHDLMGDGYGIGCRAD